MASKRLGFLATIFLLTSIVDGMHSRSKTELIMSFLKQFERESVACSVIIYQRSFDSNTKDDFDFLRELILPVYMFNADDSDSDALYQGSSYCPFHLLFFQSISNVDLFTRELSKSLRQKGSAYIVFVQDAGDMKEDLISVLKSEFFRKVKRVTFVVPESIEENTKFWVISQKLTTKGTDLRVNLWNENKLVVPQADLFPDTLDTFLGRSLRASSFVFEPFITAKKVAPNGTVLEHGGFEVQILKILAENLNFTYGRIAVPTDGLKWGRELPDGSFTGLVGDVMFERTDIGFAQFFLTPDRLDRIDFTQPYDNDYLCFAVAKPLPFPQWQSLARPLQGLTWLGVLLCILSSLAFVYIYHYTKENSKWDSSELSLVNGILFYLGTFFDVSQPLTAKLRHGSIRFAFAIYLMSMYVVTIGYRGSLISVLSVPHQPPPINSMKELAESSYPVASLGPLFFERINSSIDPDVLKIAGKYITHYDFEEAFRNVSQRRIAMGESGRFLDYSIRKRFLNRFGVASIHIIKECYVPFRVAFATSKNSIYTDRISDKIIQLSEGGIIEKWIREEMDFVAKLFNKETKASSKRLTMNNLEGPFYIWLLFIGVSIIMFSYEMVLEKILNTTNP